MHPGTSTTTYTKTHIRRVFENFAADLSMLVRRTRTMDLKWAQDTAHDVTQMALEECLSRVHIQLFGADGHRKQAREYVITRGAGLENDRPSENDWREQPGGRLVVAVSYSDWNKINTLLNSNMLLCNWGPSKHSTDYSEMRQDGGLRQYSSHGYGLTRTSYTAR